MPTVDNDYKRRLNEYEAMKKTGHSTQEVSSRLERAGDLIDMMIMALDSVEPVKTLEAIDEDIDRVIEKLADTKTILKLIIRETELIQKLKKLDETKKLTDFSAFPAQEIIALGDLENPSIDPATKERLKQQIEIHNLIDSIQASTENEEVKKKLERLHGLTGTRRVKHYVTPTIREPKAAQLPEKAYRDKAILPERPYRKLNVDIPTSKGEGYEKPGAGEE